MNIRERLLEIGLSLPEPPPPGGLYDSVRVAGDIAYVAIQFPFDNGILRYRGRLGAELTTADGCKAAEYCALNVLAQVDKYVGFDRIVAVNMIEAYLLTVDDWDEFPKVLDGASGVFVKTLGETGRHARALYGVHRLPMNAPVALTASFTLDGGLR